MNMEARIEAVPHDEEPTSIERLSTSPRVSPSTDPDLKSIVAANLRRLRTQRGLSLERLSKSSGVSRAMLSQIELEQSTPTITILWKVAKALDLPFSSFLSDAATPPPTTLRKAEARVLTSNNGFSSRSLSPSHENRRVEFHEVRLQPQSLERFDPKPRGTTENLVVHQGALNLVLSGKRHFLAAGDAISFSADVPHAYENPGQEEVVAYLVVTPTERFL